MCYHCEMCFLSVGFCKGPFVVVALENKAKRKEVAAGGAIFVHQGLLRVQLFIL